MCIILVHLELEKEATTNRIVDYWTVKYFPRPSFDFIVMQSRSSHLRPLSAVISESRRHVRHQPR